MKSIDTLHLRGNRILAPIAGFTDSPFRRVARKHGAALVVSELVSSEGIVRDVKKTTDLLFFHESERPVSLQLFGKNPDVMGEAASKVEELKPDYIDINMGCPAPRVVKAGEGAGAALLLDVENAFKIASNVVKSVSLPVTVKIRVGWNDEQKPYKEIVKAMEEAGVEMIFVHGRTAAQKYSGQADWGIIKEINAFSKVPIIGNGDILTYQQADERMEYSGCPAVMIGRGALGNPWIFSGKQPSIDEFIEQIQDHLELMIEHYGENGIILMRKHFVKYIHGFPGASKLRQQLVRVTKRDEVYRILDMLKNI